MDDKLRTLARRALVGDDHDKAAYLTAALRAGWPLAQIEAAADLSYMPARMALGRSPREARSVDYVGGDPSIDPQVFRDIAVDIVNYVRKAASFKGANIARIDKVWVFLRRPAISWSNREHDKIHRLINYTRLRNFQMLGRVFTIFTQYPAQIHGSVILEEVIDTVCPAVWPQSEFLKPFFLARLLPPLE